MLESFHQHHDADGPRDFYAKNGASSSRLRRLLQHPPCSCGCTLPFNVLRKCCQSFWSLPKQLQDSVLWSLQCESGRKTWSIEGLDIFQICSNLSFDCLVVFSLVFFLASRTSTLPTVLVEVSGDWQAKDRPYKAQIQGGRWANFEPRTLYPIYFVCFGLWFFFISIIHQSSNTSFNWAMCQELLHMKQSKLHQQWLSSCICTGRLVNQWQQSFLLVSWYGFAFSPASGKSFCTHWICFFFPSTPQGLSQPRLPCTRNRMSSWERTFSVVWWTVNCWGQAVRSFLMEMLQGYHCGSCPLETLPHYIWCFWRMLGRQIHLLLEKVHFIKWLGSGAFA